MPFIGDVESGLFFVFHWLCVTKEALWEKCRASSSCHLTNSVSSLLCLYSIAPGGGSPSLATAARQFAAYHFVMRVLRAAEDFLRLQQHVLHPALSDSPGMRDLSGGKSSNTGLFFGLSRISRRMLGPAEGTSLNPYTPPPPHPPTAAIYCVHTPRL